MNLIGLGARLKEARISKGYSLEDLQEVTKIQQRYLSVLKMKNFELFLVLSMFVFLLNSIQKQLTWMRMKY